MNGQQPLSGNVSMSHSVNSILSQIRSYQTQVSQPLPAADVARSNAIE